MVKNINHPNHNIRVNVFLQILSKEKCQSILHRARARVRSFKPPQRRPRITCLNLPINVDALHKDGSAGIIHHAGVFIFGSEKSHGAAFVQLLPRRHLLPQRLASAVRRQQQKSQLHLMPLLTTVFFHSARKILRLMKMEPVPSTTMGPQSEKM